MTTDQTSSMEMNEFEQLLNQYDYKFKKGDLVKGTVVAYDSHGALVDIGAKTVAVTPVKEITNGVARSAQEVLKIGDEREFLIVKEEDAEGQFTLSYKKVALAYNWKELETIHKEDSIIKVVVASGVKGGVIVDYKGLRGFVPSSHLMTKDVDSLIGNEIDVKILSLDPKQNNLIFSNRKVFSEQEEEMRKDVFEKLKVGDTVSGEVVRLADFGAFVDIGGIDGLLPLSQLSWRWVDHPADILKVGDKINVQVIGIDTDKNRVSLSLKNLQPDPWIEASNTIKEGQKITGKVTRLKQFGAFVEVFSGVEALLPNKEVMDYQNKNGKTLNIGDTIETTVIKFNPEDHRISLSFSERHSDGE